MTEETAKHLTQVEKARQQVSRLLAKHGYPDELRNVLVIGFIDEMVEHHESMLLLIRNGKNGRHSLSHEASLRAWFVACGLTFARPTRRSRSLRRWMNFRLQWRK